MRALVFLVHFIAIFEGLRSSKCPPIKVKKDTIIRTKESIRNGAKLLFRTDVESSRECYELCCEKKACSVGVMHYKRVRGFTGVTETQKTCFIFACGTPSRCTFMNHTGYAIIEMERGKTKQQPTNKPLRTVPQEEKCSPGMPVAMCASDPCQNAVCQGHKDATCVPNYCGGCGHGFYDSDGNKLHCQAKHKPTNEHEKPKVEHKSKDAEEVGSEKDAKQGDENNKEDGKIVKEEEVEVLPEETSGKPTEEPFVPGKKSEEDPHKVDKYRDWLDAKDPMPNTAKPNTVTTVYNGETEEPDIPDIGKKAHPKVVIKKASPISWTLLIALSICIVVLIAVIMKLKCMGPKKKKKFAVDDGDYLINGMYL